MVLMEEANKILNFRIKKLKRLIDNRKFVFFALTILTIYTLTDFFNVGFTNSDDSDNFIRAINGNYLLGASIWAKGQGRFYFYYRVLWGYIPYLMGNSIWLIALKYIPIVGSFIMFSMITSKLLKSFHMGVITYTSLLLLFSVPEEPYMLPTAYPFLFSLDLLLFLISGHFYLRYLKSRNYTNYVFSILFFTIPFMCYEAYVIIFILFLLLIIKDNYKNNPKSLLNKPALKEILPILVVGVIFYLFYFTFRAFYPSQYSGSSFASHFSFSRFSKAVFNINKSAFPTYIYNQAQNVFVFHNKNHTDNFCFLLTNSSVLKIILSFFISVLLCYYFIKISTLKISIKKLLFVIFYFLVLSYGLNIIPGLSEKYNTIGNEIDGYVTTYFAFFSFTLSIIIILIIAQKIAIHSKVTYYLFIFFVFIISFSTSIKIGYSNKYLGIDWNISEKRFELVNKILENDVFKNIPDNSVFLAKDLYETSSILGKKVCEGDFSWNKYIRAKTRRKLFFCRNMNDMKEVLAEKKNCNIYLLTKTENLSKKIFILNVIRLNRLEFSKGNYMHRGKVCSAIIQ